MLCKAIFCVGHNCDARRHTATIIEQTHKYTVKYQGLLKQEGNSLDRIVTGQWRFYMSHGAIHPEFRLAHRLDPFFIHNIT